MIRGWTLLAVSVLTVLPLASAEALSLYPGPAEKYRSQRYRAEIVQADKTQDAFVMSSVNAWKDAPKKDGTNYEWDAMSKENHWVSFSSAEAVKVLVAASHGKIRSAEILPPTPRAKARLLDDGRVEVELKPSATQADYYFLRINGAEGDQYPFFLFVDPPETDRPDPKDPKVRYFGPGVHDIGPHYQVTEGETVYIAGGALVRGTIDAKGKNIRIRGRGILSGEDLQVDWMKYNRAQFELGDKAPKPRGWQGAYGGLPMIGIDQGQGVQIEGLTLTDAPFYCISAHGAASSTIRNVKLLAWNYSTDGIWPGSSALIENAFLKVNDDVFTLYWSNILARNLVIWKQMNASVFQLGYGHNGLRKNIRLQNVQIIRDETTLQVMARGIVSMAASKGNTFQGFCIEDMTVYGDTLNLLAVDNLDQNTPWSAKVQDVALGGMDLVLKDVRVTGTERGQWWGPFGDRKGQPMRSRLRTEKGGTIRVTFDNVSINGTKLTSEKDFPNGLEQTGKVTLVFK